MGLKVGQLIPNFSLTDQNGIPFKSTDLLGSKSFVLFFYPKDNTPGCTAEVCSFRDNYEEFTDLGAEVVGISSDSEASHRRFSKKFNLPFILLSDKGGKVRKMFKVEGSLFNLLPGRETYVINKDGRVEMVFNSASSSRHMKKALATLKSM
ncbi:peroxiredoxin [Eudoraea chungangensis]|uniref:peroxiredoxin n=1 Tax=Eudoraea chungangensis TaxID=1481905 RepID=UPI0023ED8792|nr:peroxiredoxin [Eudoraea chungangensis]